MRRLPDFTPFFASFLTKSSERHQILAGAEALFAKISAISGKA
jgi:hypothetical protein